MGYLQHFHLQPHPINGRHSSSSAYSYYLKSLRIFCFLHYCLFFLACCAAGKCCPEQNFPPAAPSVRCLQADCCASLASRHAHLKLLFGGSWPGVLCSNTVLLLRRASTHPSHVSVLEGEPASQTETQGNLLAKINNYFVSLQNDYPCLFCL